MKLMDWIRRKVRRWWHRKTIARAALDHGVPADNVEVFNGGVWVVVHNSNTIKPLVIAGSADTAAWAKLLREVPTQACVKKACE